MTTRLLLPLKRRAFLQGACALTAGALVASPALPQAGVRARFARWIQWTQLTGAGWGTRSGFTIRAFPSEEYALVLRWTSNPSVAESLSWVPDPSAVVGLRMFDHYDQRPEAELDASVHILEDFTWLERSQLHENVWTSALDEASDDWLAFTQSPHAIPMDLPTSGTVVWIQPTNDIPDTSTGSQLDFSGPLSEHPLCTLLLGMLEADLFVAGSQQEPHTILAGTGVSDATSSTLVRLPKVDTLSFPAVYMRILRPPTSSS